MRLASRFGYANQIRHDRPLTHEELMRHVPSIFGKTDIPLAVNTMRTFPLSPSWKICSRKAFSRSLPARPACATRAAGNTQNTCCVCGGPDR